MTILKLIDLKHQSLHKEIKRKYTLGKEERLRSKKLVDKIFSQGDSLMSFPLKISYAESKLPNDFPVQAGFSVGKKNFKLAVQRNKIKRLMREAYRLNKFLFYDKLDDKQLAVFFIFIGKTIPDFNTVETAMKKGIKKLLKETEKKTNNNGRANYPGSD